MLYKDVGSYPIYKIKNSNETSPFVGNLAKKIGRGGIKGK